MANDRNRRQKQLRMAALNRRKVCSFCAEDIDIHYKDVGVLKDYITDCGKIIPRRISGVCASHQRKLTGAIKRARNIALLSFTQGYIPPET